MQNKIRQATRATLTPESFAHALRHQGPDAEAAYARLHEIIRSNTLRQQPVFHGLRGDCFEEKCDELIQAYCQELLESPARLTSREAMGWGLVVVDLKRFINKQGSILSLENERSALRRHLYDKIHTLLKTEDFVVGRSGCFAAGVVASDLEGALTDEAILDKLGPLPSVLVNTREGYCPEMATYDDLRAHLLEIFRIVRRPLGKDRLVELCWRSLRPAPVPQRRVDDADIFNILPARVVSNKCAEQAEVLAREFIKEVPLAMGRVVAHRFRSSAKLSYREIAQRTGISRSQIGNHCQQFEDLCRAFVRRHDLSEGEAEQLLEQALDKMASEYFEEMETDANFQGVKG